MEDWHVLQSVVLAALLAWASGVRLYLVMFIVGLAGRFGYVDLPSGLKILDAAAHRIVQLAAPFAAFPAEIRKDTDLLVITRTWFFAQGDKVWTE